MSAAIGQLQEGCFVVVECVCVSVCVCGGGGGGV